MRLVLDTSVLIAADPVPAGAQAAVASVSLAELAYGVEAGTDAVERARRQGRLELLRREFGAGLPFDDDAAWAFGRLCGVVLAAGRNPRSRALDLMIAATAYAHGAGVYTRNPDDLFGLEALVPVATP